MMTGITCPSCGATSRNVIESRRMADRVRRRCACADCGGRFTTWELRYDQIRQTVHQIAAERSARLLDRFQAADQAMADLRALMEAEFNVEEVLAIPDPDAPSVTCEQCIQWGGERCQLGFPDPLDEGTGFAAECASFKEVA